MRRKFATPLALVLFCLPTIARAVDVGQYKTLELSFNASLAPANPYDTYLLKLEVTDPNGKTFNVEGFYDGDGDGGQTGNIWKARLAPYATGTWSWKTVAADANDPQIVGKSGTFNVTDSGDRGGLVANGRYFQLQNGQPFYLNGNFLHTAGGVPSTHVYSSETISDATRTTILNRQVQTNAANKMNMYLANIGDYSSASVTPWVKTSSIDYSKMNLANWKNYDTYIKDFKNNGMLAELWFFADDSNFGSLSQTDRNRLIRYGMARTSGFSNTLYVTALEWQEWNSGNTAAAKADVNATGSLLAQKNPWDRLVSVHSLELTDWAFSDQDWTTFIASQGGNARGPGIINAYGLKMRAQDNLPHVDEEFGLLTSTSDTRQRGNMWANFASGAAGHGTGSDLKAFQNFIAQSKIPFQRMTPQNTASAASPPSSTPPYELAEIGHHYLYYNESGSFDIDVTGSNLLGYWFDPRNSAGSLSASFAVAPGTATMTPPNNPTLDWVLWISDGTNLTQGLTLISTGDGLVAVAVPVPEPTAAALFALSTALLLRRKKRSA